MFKKFLLFKYVLVFVLTGLSLTTYAADPAIRPGLWEVITTSNLLNYASQISPEQVQNLKVLADQYGLEMPEIQNGAAKSYTCIKPEMTTQKLLQDSFQPQMGCTVKNATQNGANYRMDFVCDNAQLKGAGTAEGSFTSAESFTGKTNFKGLAQGMQVNESADISGKWVNANCEATKP